MDQRVQTAVSTPEEKASDDLRRLPHLIDGARVSTGEDQCALAFEINQRLVAMRAPGHERAEARVVLVALDAHHLDGLVDGDGRACRKEAVETLMSCGFPHALEISPEDLAFARAWSPSTKEPLAPWAAQSQRNRRFGAAVVVGSEVVSVLVALLFGPPLGGAFAPLLLSVMVAIVISLSFALKPPHTGGAGSHLGLSPDDLRGGAAGLGACPRARRAGRRRRARSGTGDRPGLGSRLTLRGC